MEQVEEEINHQLKCTRKEWRVKSKVVPADEVAPNKEKDKASASAKGKSVASASVTMVFVLLAEYNIYAADEENIESLAKLKLSSEQAVFDKLEESQHRHLKRCLRCLRC